MNCISARNWALALALASLITSVQPAKAAEPFREFLEGLRTLGYYEQALDYLESMRTSHLVGEDVKKTISYEQGLILVEQAARMRNAQDRERRLDEASKRFQEFIQANPDHTLASAANSQLANVLVERARMKIAKAQTAGAKDKDSLLTAARAQLVEAEKVFTALTTKLRQQLAEFRKNPPKDQEQTDRRMQMYTDLYTADILAATVVYETGKTYPPDSKKFAETIKSASAKFAQIYKAHSKRMVGLYARMYEGRCYQELGETDKALATYTELLSSIGEGNDFRSLRAKTTRSALECWITQKKWSEAITQTAEFVSKPRGQERSDEDWLAMQYLLAVAYENAAQAEKKEADKRERLREARNLAADVMKVRGDFQDQARELMARLGSPADDPNSKPAANFQEAFERGKAALDMKELADAKANAVEDATEKAELQKQAAAQRDEALKYMKQALSLAGTDTTEEQINQTRYIVCYLLYEKGDFWEAAVLGEFIARKFPKHSSAQACGMMALAAFQNLYQKSADKTFEAEKIGSIAEYIAGAWPSTEAADKALNVLLLIVVRNGELDKVDDYVAKITPNSPRRAEAEITVGQALWAAYLQASRLPEGERPAQDKLNEMVSQAQKQLASGIEGLSKQEQVGAQLALATLSLAQMYVDTAQPDKAIALLEQDRIGPLKLIAEGHPAAKREGYAGAAQMAALRACIAATPPRFKEAEALLVTLRESAGDNPEEKQKLTARLMAMGQSIERQLNDLRRSGLTDQVASVSKGFDVFLSSVAQQEASFESLNWVAISYEGMAAGLTGNGEPPRQAVEYFERAASAYEKALAKAPSPDHAMAVRVRIADSARKMRNFDQALSTLSEILKAKSNLLSAQITAAETLQERARVERKPEYFEQAINGQRERAIWGWGRIATMTSQSPKFRDYYHQARYNLASCRYQMAQQKSNNPNLLQQAKKDISVTFTLYPELGGEEWMKKYESLLMQIQRDLNQQPQPGLNEFRQSVQEIREKAAAG